MITRRRFLATAGSATFTAPVRAEAQPAAKMPRTGILSPAPPAAAGGAPFDAFRDGLRELGYAEGKSIALEFRLANGNYERLPELAAELVRLPVDVIVTDGGDAVTRAALKATKMIPIVAGTMSSDPAASGLGVANLARPGGTVTGFILSYDQLAGKRLQLLKEIVPTVTRVGVLWDQTTGSPQLRAAQAAAPALGVQLVSLPTGKSADLWAAFDEANRHQVGALLQLASRMLFDKRKAIAERALKQRLPGMFEVGFEETDALASYGPSVSDNSPGCCLRR